MYNKSKSKHIYTYLSPHFSIEFQSLKTKTAHCAGIHI